LCLIDGEEGTCLGCGSGGGAASKPKTPQLTLWRKVNGQESETWMIPFSWTVQVVAKRDAADEGMDAPAERASPTRPSKTAMYCRNRFRPSVVSFTRVWGRLLREPFQISRKPVS